MDNRRSIRQVIWTGHTLLWFMCQNKRTLLSGLLLMLGSCSVELTNEHLTSNAIPTRPGATYFLPAQAFPVSLTYTLLSCPDANKGELLRIRKDVSIGEEIFADLNERYLVPYETLSQGNKQTTFTITTYSNGTLKSAGLTIDDRTAEIAGSVLTVGFTIARMAVGIPAIDEPPAIQCTEGADARLQRLREIEQRLENSYEIVYAKEREALQDIASRLRMALTITSTRRFIPGAKTPSADLVEDVNVFRRWLVIDRSREESVRVSVGTTRVCVVSGQSGATEDVCASGESQFPPRNSRSPDGLVYREPLRATIVACDGACRQSQVIGSRDAWIPQLGPYRNLTLESMAFQDKNVSATFAPDGRVESLGFGSGAQLEAIAGVAAQTTKETRTFLSELERKEYVTLRQKIDLLNAEADLIEAERRLMALRSANGN